MKVDLRTAPPLQTASEGTCTTREAALRLGASLRAVQLWVEAGVLDAWKTPGGHRRISIDSVDRLIASRSSKRKVGNATKPPLAQHKVLVVEDDPSLLKLYEMNLTGWQPPVSLRLAENGYEGLIRLGEEKPDLLITDLMMPGIDGFRMLRALHARQDLQGLRIVVVTGLDPAQIADRGGLPPGVTLLPKPVPFDELESIVRNLDRPIKENAL